VDHLLEQATISLEEKEHKEKLAILTFEEFRQVNMDIIINFKIKNR